MQFGLDVLELVDGMPWSQKGKVVCFQLVKAATSVGANYRAACRARSKREHVANLQIVLEEADESHFWLEMIGRSRMLPEELICKCRQEADELTAIFNSCLFRLRGDEA